MYEDSQFLVDAAVKHIAKAPVDHIGKAMDYVASLLQGLVICPADLTRFKVVGLAPTLKEAYDVVLEGLRKHGMDRRTAAQLRARVNTSQSLPLTSALQNIVRNLPAMEEMKRESIRILGPPVPVLLQLWPLSKLLQSGQQRIVP